MFGSIGGTELLVILVIALLVFGPRKLPSLGRTIGKALGEFRRASHDFKDTLEREINVEDAVKSHPAAPARPEPSPDAEKPALPAPAPPPPDKPPTG